MGAIIGYITNWLAIKMLFRPHEQKFIFGMKVPFTPGLIPKEQKRIAKSVGKAVGEHLLSEETVVEALSSEKVYIHLKKLIENKVDMIANESITIREVLDKGFKEQFFYIQDRIKNNIEDLVMKNLKKSEVKEKTKGYIKEKIAEGFPLILVGTHAILEDDVQFQRLGIIITDEQHRFGVHQRSKLINKNSDAHVLVMTATPIPRTLSLYLYSDLDISIIDELPPGRKKIDTIYYNEENRHKAYELATREIGKGRQVYIVSPLIEENEDLKLKAVMSLQDELKDKYFSNTEISVLHGKMKNKEKDDIMNKFKQGVIKVLISTTVIEVGVNVPNASVMIIENAERFGLSQLHQLRGRVGRGENKSYCILIAKANNNITKKRMNTMVMSNDGFFIAEEDLKIRGSGDMFGISQHGDDGLVLSNLIEDSPILKMANMEGRKIVESKDKSHVDFCINISDSLEKSAKYICFN